MINSEENIQKKEKCILCEYAPVIFFMILDIIGALSEIAYNTNWILFQILICFIYIRKTKSVKDLFEIEKDNRLTIKVNGYLIILTVSVLLRFLILKSLL